MCTVSMLCPTQPTAPQLQHQSGCHEEKLLLRHACRNLMHTECTGNMCTHVVLAGLDRGIALLLMLCPLAASNIFTFLVHITTK